MTFRYCKKIPLDARFFTSRGWGDEEKLEPGGTSTVRNALPLVSTRWAVPTFRGGSQDRLYTSSIKSLNQSGRARSTYAARNGTMGTMENVMSTAIKPMAMSQICRSEMAGGGTVDSAWGM